MYFERKMFFLVEQKRESVFSNPHRSERKVLYVKIGGESAKKLAKIRLEKDKKVREMAVSPRMNDGIEGPERKNAPGRENLWR